MAHDTTAGFKRLFKTGSKSTRDPEHMLATVTCVPLDEWMELLRAERNAKTKVWKHNRYTAKDQLVSGEMLFSEWERAFIDLMVDTIRTTRNHEHPLTGKQLVLISYLVDAVAADTARRLAKAVR